MTVTYQMLKDEIFYLRQLLQVYEAAFEWQNYNLPDDKYLNQLLNKEDHLVLVALVNGEVVGGLTAYILYGYEVPVPFIYIYDLAVKQMCRGKGIGSGLINALKAYAAAHGISEFYVTTEQDDNDGVIDFYRQSPIESEVKVLQFNYRV